MTSNYKRIGDYIRLVDVRNKNLEVEILLGLSISKEFIPSVANTVGTDMAIYKIIKKGQFACSLMQVRRDKKIPVALQRDFDEAIVSQAYPVFEVVNTDLLDPDYLMMWMSRSEFDRQACFLAVGGVRGSLEWEDFCDMNLPVPSIEMQREIVREYNVVNDRISLNEKLIQKLEDTAQAIYKQWFVDFEFPISKEYAASIGKPELEGRPYKSSGGQMFYSEEYGQELPIGWVYGYFGQIVKVQSGYAFKSFEFVPSGEYKIIKIKNITPPIINLDESMKFRGKVGEKLEKYLANFGDVLISMTGSTANQMNSAVGQVGRYLLNYKSLINQRIGLLAIKNSSASREFCFQFISSRDTHLELLAGSTGSANQANISPSQIEELRLPIPTDEVFHSFDSITNTIVDYIALCRRENCNLDAIKTMINAKMSKV